MDDSDIGPDQHPYHRSYSSWDVSENTDSTFGVD
jgi:hypothetical protein